MLDPGSIEHLSNSAVMPSVLGALLFFNLKIVFLTLQSVGSLDAALRFGIAMPSSFRIVCQEDGLVLYRSAPSTGKG